MLQHLVPRATYYSNGNGRYLPDDKTCPETGIWDTREHRCRTKQDEVDEQRAAQEDKEFQKRMDIGLGVVGGVTGLGAATAIGLCIRSRRKRRA